MLSCRRNKKVFQSNVSTAKKMDSKEVEDVDDLMDKFLSNLNHLDEEAANMVKVEKSNNVEVQVVDQGKETKPFSLSSGGGKYAAGGTSVGRPRRFLPIALNLMINCNAKMVRSFNEEVVISKEEVIRRIYRALVQAYRNRIDDPLLEDVGCYRLNNLMEELSLYSKNMKWDGIDIDECVEEAGNRCMKTYNIGRADDMERNMMKCCLKHSETVLKSALECQIVNETLIKYFFMTSKRSFTECINIYVKDLQNCGDVLTAIDFLVCDEPKRAVELMLKVELYEDAVLLLKQRFEPNEVTSELDEVYEKWAQFLAKKGDHITLCKLATSLGFLDIALCALDNLKEPFPKKNLCVQFLRLQRIQNGSDKLETTEKLQKKK